MPRALPAGLSVLLFAAASSLLCFLLLCLCHACPQGLVAEKEKHPSKDLISDAIQQQAGFVCAHALWCASGLKAAA